MNVILLIFLSFISNLNAPGSQDDLSNASASQDHVRVYTFEQCKADYEGFQEQDDELSALKSLLRYFFQQFLQQPNNSDDQFIEEIEQKDERFGEIFRSLKESPIFLSLFNRNELSIIKLLDRCITDPLFLLEIQRKIQSNLIKWDSDIARVRNECGDISDIEALKLVVCKLIEGLEQQRQELLVVLRGGIWRSSVVGALNLIEQNLQRGESGDAELLSIDAGVTIENLTERVEDLTLFFAHSLGADIQTFESSRRLDISISKLKEFRNSLAFYSMTPQERSNLRIEFVDCFMGFVNNLSVNH